MGESPRVMCRAEEQRLSDGGLSHLGGIGVAEDQKSRRLKAFGQFAVVRGDDISEKSAAFCGGQSGNIAVEVFDEEWNASDGGVCRHVLCFGTCLFITLRDDSVEGGVTRFNTGDRSIDEFETAHFACSNECSQTDGVVVVEKAFGIRHGYSRKSAYRVR